MSKVGSNLATRADSKLGCFWVSWHNLAYVPQAHSTAGGVQGETWDFPTWAQVFSWCWGRSRDCLQTQARGQGVPRFCLILAFTLVSLAPHSSKTESCSFSHLIPRRYGFCLWCVVLPEAVEGVLKAVSCPPDWCEAGKRVGLGGIWVEGYCEPHPPLVLTKICLL